MIHPLKKAVKKLCGNRISKGELWLGSEKSITKSISPVFLIDNNPGPVLWTSFFPEWFLLAYIFTVCS
jgi:hypothetical protein